MLVSSFGMPVFLLRKRKTRSAFVVEAPDRERPLVDYVEVPEARWPRVRRAASIGLGAGLLGGLIVGLVEALVVLTSSSGAAGASVLAYGAIAYGLVGASVSAMACATVAALGRAIKREADDESSVYARTTAAVVALCGFGLTAFRVRRDLFREELEWKSLLGIGVLLACLFSAGLVYAALARLLRSLTSKRRGALLLRTWGTPAIAAPLVIALLLVSRVSVAGQHPAPQRAPGASAPTDARANIIVLVVDTLRP